MAVKDLVNESIDGNTITIFSKSWCPYCKKAKALFKEKYPDVEAKIFEIDLMDEGTEIQSYLYEKTGQRTVPNIFVKKQHIGGNDDTQAAAKNGRLDKLIRAQ
ncbi:hypothetical protein D9757_008385 [Collybiopsis confluens]|uniref:glutathione peroxidase n=1 Tax=Collybiopsis confluens TaxID=2823264 RepID=A0A8H5M6R9_9AGAR|nr:hypothetical protein D9757_012074 [Collybiopsis confluens]KAF5383330.1 hypothetical protein D9757_008385 [Collybiopsis confluens]